MQMPLRDATQRGFRVVLAAAAGALLMGSVAWAQGLGGPVSARLSFEGLDLAEIGSTPLGAGVPDGLSSLLAEQTTAFVALTAAAPTDYPNLVTTQAVALASILFPVPQDAMRLDLSIIQRNGTVTVKGTGVAGPDAETVKIDFKTDTPPVAVPFTRAGFQLRPRGEDSARVTVTVDDFRMGALFIPLPLPIIPPFNLATTAQKLILQLDEGGAATAAAARALGTLGLFGAGAIDKLKQIVCNPDPGNADVARNAARALGCIAKSLGIGAPPDLVSFLTDKLQPGMPLEVRLAALEALAAFGTPEAVQALLNALADPQLKASAIIALGNAGPDAAAAIDALKAIVANPGEPAFCRHQAAQALGKIGAAAVPALLMLLQTGDAATRGFVIGPLGEAARAQMSPLGPPPSVLALIDVVQNGTPSESAAALDALVASGDCSPQTIQAIIDALGDTRGLGLGTTVKQNAERVLGELGKKVLPLLQQAAVSHANALVRACASSLLGTPALADRSSEAALATAVCDTDASVRTAAANSLGILGGK